MAYCDQDLGTKHGNFEQNSEDSQVAHVEMSGLTTKHVCFDAGNTGFQRENHDTKRRPTIMGTKSGRMN